MRLEKTLVWILRVAAAAGKEVMIQQTLGSSYFGLILVLPSYSYDKLRRAVGKISSVSWTMLPVWILFSSSRCNSSLKPEKSIAVYE
ncbi:hypothetical protein C5167_047427 [Papaver somniferum]|uniref:Uncharacterized protein n=1 Tax=Papaver somniferum TaxID=3469 RepID=A0A4Y7LGM1_PAPSO|nr:hypothetical protein C5167_047427 [Papaver somniferum]